MQTLLPYLYEFMKLLLLRIDRPTMETTTFTFVLDRRTDIDFYLSSLHNYLRHYSVAIIRRLK